MTDRGRSIAELVGQLAEHLGEAADFQLNPGVDPAQLDAAEAELGYRLPDDVRELFLAHDGQQLSAAGLFMGGRFDPLEECLRAWRFQRETYGPGRAEVWEGMERSEQYAAADPEVRELWADDRWFPIYDVKSADIYSIDLDPADGGSVGQLIHHGYEIDRLTTFAPSLRAWFERVLELAAEGAITFRADRGGSWGIGPAGESFRQLPEWWASSDNAQSLPAWALEEPDPAWRAYFERAGISGTRYFLQHGVQGVPAGACTLRPLDRVRDLSILDLRGYALSGFDEIPDNDGIHRLKVDEVDSLAGIERFADLTALEVASRGDLDLTPLATLAELDRLTVKGAVADFAPLAGSKELAMIYVGEFARGLGALADLEPLEKLGVTLRSVAHGAELGRLTQLHVLTLSMTDDPSELDWSGLGGLAALHLYAPNVKDFGFLTQLPKLSLLTLGDMREVELETLAEVAAQRDWHNLSLPYDQLVLLTEQGVIRPSLWTRPADFEDGDPRFTEYWAWREAQQLKR